MKKSMFLILGLAAIMLTSCARIYQSPDADLRAVEHQTIAVIPPKVTIEAPRRVSSGAIKEQQRSTGLNIQQEMFSWLLKRKRQGKIYVDILDVQTTNAKLKKAGFFDGTPLTPQEVSELLGVDAIITSNYLLTKPISDGASVALIVLTGSDWGNNKETSVSLDLYDAQSQKMIWNYNNTHGGQIWESHADLVNDVLRHASRKMPYVQ